ncbi:unnamed protein product [Penicillium egyptiacum]|uniref:Uncharacterized protein n=1 Tax=Penicillium egyptiacum TaxID=1303716 RepID=A0A9W4KFA0_9EURO|nr:unnamed protein product [Penicillium egyptiacum]
MQTKVLPYSRAASYTAYWAFLLAVSRPLIGAYAALLAFVATIVLNVVYQFLFRMLNQTRPPLYGDIFTFILLGRPTTVYLGAQGNEFILNGKLKDVNAEEVYSPLTAPVFGSDVAYDCPNSKLIKQKEFIKIGLSQAALEAHVPLIEKKVRTSLLCHPIFMEHRGQWISHQQWRRLTSLPQEALSGEKKCGFTPINSMLPWAPLPHNKKRDAAHAQMRAIYVDIINKRRNAGDNVPEKLDMIGNLMQCTNKNGEPLPDREIAHIMITLLMAGQHSSSSLSPWIMLRLVSQPAVVEELYQEQVANIERTGPNGTLAPLRLEDIDNLPLRQNVIREILRVNSLIHSLLRKVKNPLPVPGTPYVIPTSHVLLAAPGVTALTPDENKKEDIVDYGYGAMSKGTSSPYLPFGAGRHRCIGEKFAYLNLAVIVATMVRHLRFHNLDEKKGVPDTDYSSLFSGRLKPARIGWECGAVKFF